jgi:multidrug efflux pump subunit AcrB
MRRALSLGLVALVATLPLTTSCRRLKLVYTPVVIEVDGAAAAVDAVYAAASALPDVVQVHATTCRGRGHVSVSGVATDVVAAAVAGLALPDGGRATVQSPAAEVAVFVVKGADPFATRAVVDAELLPRLARVPGVERVFVQGGDRDEEVHVDLARLIAAGVTLPEVIQAAGGAASLESVIVKSVKPATSTPETEAPSMMKAAPPPPVEGEVRVLLKDVADIGSFPVGPPLRRDGGLEVRVYGSADRAAVVAAAVVDDKGVSVAILDDDSVEAVDVVINAKADVDALRRTFAALPGVTIVELPTVVDVVIDEARAQKLGVPLTNIRTVVAAATSGTTLVRNTKNVTLRVETPSAELLSQLELQNGARLYDVATVQMVPAIARERVNRDDAVRLRLHFGVGVRKNALAAIERTTRSAGGFVERRVLDVTTCAAR